MKHVIAMTIVFRLTKNHKYQTNLNVLQEQTIVRNKMLMKIKENVKNKKSNLISTKSIKYDMKDGKDTLTYTIKYLKRKKNATGRARGKQSQRANGCNDDNDKNNNNNNSNARKSCD